MATEFTIKDLFVGFFTAIGIVIGLTVLDPFIQKYLGISLGGSIGITALILYIILSGLLLVLILRFITLGHTPTFKDWAALVVPGILLLLLFPLFYNLFPSSTLSVVGGAYQQMQQILLMG